MGQNIYSFAEIRKDDKWQFVDNELFAEGAPFTNRNYCLFGFLADMCNYAKSPYFYAKGFPEDSEYLNRQVKGFDEKYRPRIKDIEDLGCSSPSYLTLKELIDYDYSTTFENRRVKNLVSILQKNAGVTYPEGEGEQMSMRDFLKNSDLFPAIEVMEKLGDPKDVRVVFYFDA